LQAFFSRFASEKSAYALKGVEFVDPPVFVSPALEMLIPPWFGKEHFMKFVYWKNQIE
jgi:hypothetical protein